MQHKWLKRRSKLILVSVLFLVIVLSGCRSPSVEINGKIFAVEIADTPEERAQGLMFRKELCRDCGMLFIFEQEERVNFWMKNTPIPLDMIFIDKDGMIVDILPAEPCVDDPCSIYRPQGNAQYVLEINSGVSEANHLLKGMTVHFS